MSGTTGSFECLGCGLVSVDEIPIVGDAEAGALGDGDLAIGGEVLGMIGVTAGVDGGGDVGHVGAHEGHFVHVGVADGGDAGAVGGAAGVELEVEAEGFAEVGDFHDAGDAHVVFGVGVDHVAAALEEEVGFLFEAADVFADE